jgi:hypothetical protein
VLRVGAGATVNIPLQLFNSAYSEGTTGIARSGRTIELDFSTHGIRNYDAPIISCLDVATSDFYEIETSFANDESRKDGFTVEYDYDKLRSMLPCADTRKVEIFTYNNGG